MSMSENRSIRVRHENGERFAALLRAAGFEAEYAGAGTASAFEVVYGECERHEAFFLPQNWGSVRTTASGRQAHAIWFPA